MTYTAFAPNGARITGQRCVIAVATAGLHSFSVPDASSEASIDFSGSTDIGWDSQTPVRVDGELLYEDENGDTWKASQLTFRTEADENGGDGRNVGEPAGSASATPILPEPTP